MRIVVWPADQSASGHYRLIWPAQALQAAGHDVHFDTTGPTCMWDREWSGPTPSEEATLLGIYGYDADIVVMQRPARRWWTDMIPLLQQQGITVVVDVDDRFDRIHPDNVAHEHYDPALNVAHSHHWIDQACRTANIVTCSTPSLEQRYGYGHGVVLPNLVPDWYLTIEPVQRYDRVGWAGNVDTHPGDLEVTDGAVPRALIRTGWEFQVIGSGRGVMERLGHRSQYASGWVPFERYPYQVAELAVGIVPLELNEFNAGKSCLKLAEYASLGVAAVASPTPDNIRLQKQGVGLLAWTVDKWERHLVALMRSADYRTDVAGKSRQAMTRNTYAAQGYLWGEAWNSSTSLARSAA